MFTGLQALRFVAATAIVLFHSFHYGIIQKVLPTTLMSESPNILSSGVPVFFALSGFLMAKLSDNASPLRFIFHRVLRIYPAYLSAVFLTVALKLALFGSVHPPSLESLSLLPFGNMEYTLGVEWTLVYEIFFYVVATCLCILPKNSWRILVVAAWLASIVVANQCFSRPFTTILPTITQIPFSYLNVTFIAGMACWWFRSWLEGLAVPMCVLGLGLICASSWIPVDHYWLMRHFVNISGAALLVAASSTDQVGRLFGRRSVAVWLGNGSYGIYLLHVPIVTVLFAMSPPGVLAVAIAIAAALAVGGAFGIAEYRLYSAITRYIDRMVYKPAAWTERQTAVQPSA